VRTLTIVTVVLAAISVASRSQAASRCEGPDACCGPLGQVKALSPVRVSVGLAIEGIHNLDEKTGGWDVDYYLYEKWPPTLGFTPQTEIVNELSRQDFPNFDLVELRNGLCERSRRLHSTLRVDYDLRRFPFDQQNLLLVLSDAEFDATQMRYVERPTVADIDAHVYTQVSGWRIPTGIGYSRDARRFTGEEGSPLCDYATFTVPVGRRTTFHMIKYFLPLFLIVVVGFSVFWIEPDDLNTQVSIGVTCLLAAIAFQYAESSSLPEASYLTLADRVYVACYLAIVSTMLESVYTHSISKKGNHRRAVRIEKRARLVFPTALVLAIVVSVVLSYRP
jgi:hypothetical protein